MKIKDSVALVTGSNRGIGHEFVRALLRRGAAKVYAGVRNPEAERAIVALDPARVTAIQFDITRPGHIAAAARRAHDVTLLINNAGVLEFGSVLDTSEEAARRNMEVNYFGTLSVTRAIAPAIEHNGGGAVVNVLTLVALASMPGLGVYNASKAAAWSLTQSLRADLKKRRIDVHGIFPGAVDTDMIRAIEMPKTSPEDVVNMALDGVERGDEDIFPDAMSQQLYENWRQDHKAVERQFAVM